MKSRAAKQRALSRATLRPFKKILCHIDFSTTSIEILRIACDLAKRSGGELFVLHIVKRISALTMDASVSKVLMHEAGIEIAKILDTYVPRGLKHRGIVIYNDPVNEIIRIIKRRKIDVFVVSAHGTGGFHSIKNRVMKLIDCPVLLIPVSKKRTAV